MKIDAQDIETFRWYIDDHLDEVITTLKQYKDLCLEDENLALLSEKTLDNLDKACHYLNIASIEILEVGLDMFGEQNGK